MTDRDAELAVRIDEFGSLLAAVEGRLDQNGYERVEHARLLLGKALTAEPELTARLAGRVFPLFALEPSLTGQLVFPLVAAVGRRSALVQLIDLARQGGWQRRANACGAAYWVAVWVDPRPMDTLREEVRHGRVTPEQAREWLQAARERERMAAEPLDDLWPSLWEAAAACFVHAPDPEVRSAVGALFPLDDPRLPASAGPLFAEARRITENDPEAYGRLLNGSTGLGVAIR